MTPHRLTDEQLAAGLRAHLPAAAHAGLRERILEEVTSTAQARRLPAVLAAIAGADPAVSRRMALIVALAGLALTVSFAAMAGALLRQLQPAPDLTVVPTLAPITGERVRGWPDTTENVAGLYSWDGVTCAGPHCNHGFMHNGYGANDVEIVIQGSRSERLPADDVTPVIVAGHPGVYRKVDDLKEEWFVTIEGMTIHIRLTARFDATEEHRAEARAIVESMLMEPRDTRMGFRLVFRLTTDTWDSG